MTSDDMAIAKEYLRRWDEYTRAVYGNDGAMTAQDYMDASRTVYAQMGIEGKLTEAQQSILQNLILGVAKKAEQENIP